MISFNQALEALEPTTLRISASGQMVLYLQIALQDLGHYTGVLDGQFGPVTAAALQSFQEHVGIPATGEFDMASWYAINFWLPNSRPPAETLKCRIFRHLKDAGKIRHMIRTLIMPQSWRKT